MIWAIRTTLKATDIVSASLLSSLCVSAFMCVCDGAIRRLSQFLGVGLLQFVNQILRVHVKMYISDLTECLRVFILWTGFLGLRNCMDSR